MGKSGKPGKTPSESFHMPVDETRWRIFIETVRKTGSLRKGATAASPHQVSGERHGCVSSFVNLAKRDPQKAQELEAAISEALGNLEATIYDHAVNGTERPIFQGGVQVGKEIQFDHRTALEILRRHDPAWRERTIVEQDPATRHLQLTPSDVRLLPPEDQRIFLGYLIRIDEERKKLELPSPNAPNQRQLEGPTNGTP